MQKEDYKRIAIVAIFAIAMGFLEAVIVVYLRRLYYPEGFTFPLSPLITPDVLNIEWVREFFTIVMLACIGILAGKKLYEKLAYFLYAFAIWDIFYYVWLKVLLTWPHSFFTRDLLFLIPWPWISPVLAPVICSLTMIALAFSIIHLKNKVKNIYFNLREWLLLIAGSIIILYTFLIDYAKLIFANGFAGKFFSLATDKEFAKLVANFLPTHYSWILFFIGEAILITAIVLFWIRNQHH